MKLLFGNMILILLEKLDLTISCTLPWIALDLLVKTSSAGPPPGQQNVLFKHVIVPVSHPPHPVLAPPGLGKQTRLLKKARISYFPLSVARRTPLVMETLTLLRYTGSLEWSTTTYVLAQ